MIISISGTPLNVSAPLNEAPGGTDPRIPTTDPRITTMDPRNITTDPKITTTDLRPDAELRQPGEIPTDPGPCLNRRSPTTELSTDPPTTLTAGPAPGLEPWPTPALSTAR